MLAIPPPKRQSLTVRSPARQDMPNLLQAAGLTGAALTANAWILTMQNFEE
jgi:hypothetical protein